LAAFAQLILLLEILIVSKIIFSKDQLFFEKRRIFRNILRILKFRNAIIKNNKLFGTHVAEAASVLPSCKYWFLECSLALECSIASKRFSSNY